MFAHTYTYMCGSWVAPSFHKFGNQIWSELGSQTNPFINIAGNMIFNRVTQSIREWIRGKVDGGQWSAVVTPHCPVPSGNTYIQSSPSEKQ